MVFRNILLKEMLTTQRLLQRTGNLLNKMAAMPFLLYFPMKMAPYCLQLDLLLNSDKRINKIIVAKRCIRFYAPFDRQVSFPFYHQHRLLMVSMLVRHRLGLRTMRC